MTAHSSTRQRARDWFERVENFILAAAPVLFRFVEWAVVVGGLWFVTSRARSIWASVILYVLIGAWTLYLSVSVFRWSEHTVMSRVRSKWLKLLVLVPAVALAWGVVRVAITVSADVTGANLSDEARDFFFMPTEQREWMQRALSFEHDSGARPPFPGQTVVGIAAGVASVPGTSGGTQVGIAVITDSGELRTGVLVAELKKSDPAMLALLQAAVASKRRITLTSCMGDLVWPAQEVGKAKQPHGAVMVHSLQVDGYTFAFPCLWVPPRKL